MTLAARFHSFRVGKSDATSTNVHLECFNTGITGRVELIYLKISIPPLLSLPTWLSLDQITHFL